MNKSVIVYGPQGCGKTRFAERIAKHFGLAGIVDDFGDGNVINGYGTLYLTTVKPTGWSQESAISFAEVARQINAAIPKSQWFGPSDEPAIEGWYEVQVPRSSRVKPFDGQNMKFENGWWRHNCRQVNLELGDKWRGLLLEPLPI